MVFAASPAVHPSLQFDTELIRRLDRPGPCYASYPTADRFSDSFRYGDYLQAVSSVRARGSHKALSLCMCIPFCESGCHHCSRNKIVTRNRDQLATYLDYLGQEIALQGELFSGMNHLSQLYLGGGTPTCLSDTQISQLMAQVRSRFVLANDETGDYAIEIDLRTITSARMHMLRFQGFNRVSLCVPDFEPEVQKAINRMQPESLTMDTVLAARAARFRSIGIDFIYGLPRQSLVSMRRTLSTLIEVGPDRFAICAYQHLPKLFSSQKRIRTGRADLPDSAVKLDMYATCVELLDAAGYVHIGMGHFVKPEDALAVAQSKGRLHRNFLGYSTHAGADVVSCGVAAIGSIGGTLSENAQTLEAYYECIDCGELPVVRGIRLGTDDLLRRIVIERLTCNFELAIKSLELAYPISFSSYFAPELEQLHALAAEGLLEIDEEWITVMPKGRFLIGRICMVFDRYLYQKPILPRTGTGKP